MFLLLQTSIGTPPPFLPFFKNIVLHIQSELLLNNWFYDVKIDVTVFRNLEHNPQFKALKLHLETSPWHKRCNHLYFIAIDKFCIVLFYFSQHHKHLCKGCKETIMTHGVSQWPDNLFATITIQPCHFKINILIWLCMISAIKLLRTLDPEFKII